MRRSRGYREIWFGELVKYIGRLVVIFRGRYNGKVLDFGFFILIKRIDRFLMLENLDV